MLLLLEFLLDLGFGNAWNEFFPEELIVGIPLVVDELSGEYPSTQTRLHCLS